VPFGSGSPSREDVTCASPTQTLAGAGDRRVVTTGSAASNDARWASNVGARIHADCGGSTRLQHANGGSWRTSHGTTAFAPTNATGSPDAGACYGTAQCRLRLRQGLTMLRQCTTYRSGSFDLTSGPGGPAGFQRQDGIGRRSLGKGRRVRCVIPAWRGQRTETNQKGRRPSWTAWGALSPRATVAVHRKMNTCIVGFRGARPLAAPAYRHKRQ
jgi:hypothetical protein